MNTHASVVVIGGGVMGTSIAYHLAAAGVRDVLLVERDALGAGSTSKAAGGVRAQFSDELNIQLGARSLEAFARFGEEIGQDIGLHRVGYPFLLSTPEEVASFEAGVRLQNALGVPSRMIDPGEARRLSPLISTDGLRAAAYSPDDGHCTPEAVVQGYAAAARRCGARVLRHTEVTGIETRGSRITAVTATLGRIDDRRAAVGGDPRAPRRRGGLRGLPQPGQRALRRPVRAARRLAGADLRARHPAAGRLAAGLEAGLRGAEEGRRHADLRPGRRVGGCPPDDGHRP
ncbi:glycine/D-amino acid oxidase-like deaminating enzyme [Streptomyces phaeoluteigriseus]